MVTRVANDRRRTRFPRHKEFTRGLGNAYRGYVTELKEDWLRTVAVGGEAKNVTDRSRLVAHL